MTFLSRWTHRLAWQETSCDPWTSGSKPLTSTIDLPVYLDMEIVSTASDEGMEFYQKEIDEDRVTRFGSSLSLLQVACMFGQVLPLRIYPTTSYSGYWEKVLIKNDHPLLLAIGMCTIYSYVMLCI